MDFSELLNIAAQNQSVAESKASVKVYSTTVRAPKKYSSSNVQSQAVQKFLAKKKYEEEQKALEEQRKKEHLLSLRSQNTKSGKKARVMASRTKDNDFGQMPEMTFGYKTEAKINIEAETSRVQLSGIMDVSKNNKTPSRQESNMSYEDLLQLATQKQNQPAKHSGAEVRNSDSRPLTKKQKDLLREEQAREQRRLYRENAASAQPKTNPSRDKDRPGNAKKPAEKNKSPMWKSCKDQESGTARNLNQVISQTAISRPLTGVRKFENKALLNKVKNHDGTVQNQVRSAPSVSRVPNQKFAAANQPMKDSGKMPEGRKNVLPNSANLVKTVHNGMKGTSSGIAKMSTGIPPQGRHPPGKVTPGNRPLNIRPETTQRPSGPQVKTLGKTEDKHSGSKSFHMNPYMDEPLEVFEPHSSQKKQGKRRVESGDEDDDMSDFIDDEPCHEDVNYSKYIQQIFRVDRRKIVDDDDDDIMETSYAEQMKEEKRSAKLGYMEDLEDIRKEQEEKKRKMLKKKRV